MKLALRALLVTVVAAVVTQTSAAAQGSTPVTLPNSIVFWNAQDGLFAGDQCPHVSFACNHGVIERTSDGGRTYHPVFRAHGTFELQSVGSHGAIATTASGMAWRTLDGGKTWQHVSSKLTADWLNPRVGIRFRGYIVDKHIALAMLVTRNGGRTWQRQYDPCQKADVAANASADLVTPALWWIVCEGEGAAGNEAKAVYRTRNGGKTWQSAAATVLAEHGGISSYGYPVGLAFAPDGWGLLTESRGALYVSHDGGMHFRAEPHVAHPEVDFAGGAAAFDGGIGYVFLGETNPRLLRTLDYGRTWQVVRRWG